MPEAKTQPAPSQPTAAKEQPKDGPKKRRKKNPSYPAMPLREALELTRKVFDKEQRHEVPVTTIFKHWGLSDKSSAGFTNLATLAKYGLLDGVTSGEGRKAKVSDAAYKILMDTRQNSQERKALLQAAAQKPEAIKELREKFGLDLPSDDNLRYYLTVDGEYSTHAANELIKVHRDNISFADLNQGDTISGGGAEKENPPDGSKLKPPLQNPPGHQRRKMPPSADVKEVPILLDGDREALLVLPRPFSEADLADLKKSIDFLGKKLLSKPEETDADETT